jgi:malate dehydrogenase
MERNDLLQANAAIFGVQGKALNDNASKDVRVLVVGNPANTNALITMKNAPDIKPQNITAMTRLDHNRAVAQLAEKTSSNVSEITRLCIWGNHSTTQYPDIHHALVKDKPAIEMVDMEWYEKEYIPKVAKRGAVIIEARGASSAASAANAALEHMRDWVLGSPENDWVSMGVPSDGSYGISEGLIYSYPVSCKNGVYNIVQGLDINEFSQNKLNATQKELEEERDAISSLLG